MNNTTGEPIESGDNSVNTAHHPIVLPDGKKPIPLGSGVITKLLGRGGTASVYEIWNSQMEISRAVKVINPNATDAARHRFQTEFKISAKLKHPNIVEIHGVGEWHDLPFIEMEKIDGIGLDHLIAQRGALPAAVCTSVGIMICKALQYAHTQDCTLYGVCYQGVIHRDLKPQNIMVCSTGTVKLMDFGIARPIDTSFKTIDGLISGTLQFLSPEQLEKGKLDFRTDLYSLGVTMFEMVTGVNPFPQTSFVDLVSHKTRNKFRSIESFPVNLPNRLKRVIYNCMHHDPQKRGNSAAAILKELVKIHHGLTVKSPEEVIAYFLSESNGSKVILRSRRRFPMRSSAAIASIALFAACFYRFGMLDKHKRFVHGITSAAIETLHRKLLRYFPQLAVKSPEGNKQLQPAAAARIDSLPTKPPAFAVATAPSTVNAKVKRTRTLLTSLHAEYGTDDNLSIMEKSLEAKNYSTVLAVFDFLTPEQSRTPQALIYKMRALDSIGDNSQLTEFLDVTDLSDGEFYIAKARIAYQNRNYPGCKLLLKIGLGSPHALIDYDALKREVYYYTALCATAQFNAEPAEQYYKEALDAWWQLKSALQSDPGHPYNKKAAVELQRMARQMQKE